MVHNVKVVIVGLLPGRVELESERVRPDVYVLSGGFRRGTKGRRSSIIPTTIMHLYMSYEVPEQEKISKVGFGH